MPEVPAKRIPECSPESLTDNAHRHRTIRSQPVSLCCPSGLSVCFQVSGRCE